ncbi:MAG: hypothetical protein P4M11_13665 [Candidatus Pacebacteria bacterium]|nr:hypothetical protein [Candidatus Paceibacterota bacterium]
MSTSTPQEVIPVETNVHFVDCASAWKGISKTEQLYAYYFARAAWEGAKVCAFQRYRAAIILG